MLHYRWRCGNKNIENIKYKFSIRTISFCALTFSYDDIYFFFYHFYKLCASCSTVQMYAHIKLCTFICQQQFYALKCMISFGMQREWRAKKKSTTSWFNTIGILHGFAFEMFLHEIKILHNGWNCVFFKERQGKNITNRSLTFRIVYLTSITIRRLNLRDMKVHFFISWNLNQTFCYSLIQTKEWNYAQNGIPWNVPYFDFDFEL